MDAVKLLVNNHTKIEFLFENYNNVGDVGSKAIIAERICNFILVHLTVEEELFFPRALEMLDDDNQSLIDHVEQEHIEIKDMIAEIKTMVVGSELDAKLAELKKAVEHHIHEEEDKIFPKLQVLGMETINLGIQMASRKSQLMGTIMSQPMSFQV